MTQGKSSDTFGLKDPDEWDPEETEEVVVVNSKASASTPDPASASSGYVL